MIHTVKKNKAGVPKDKINLLTDKYISILDTAAEEYEKNPPAKNFMDGYNLYKRLRDYQTDHSYFLSHPEIDCTNNISERQLRKFISPSVVLPAFYQSLVSLPTNFL